jgi:transposase
MGKPKQNLSKKKILESIPGSGGIISTIASRLGCGWVTAKRHIERHEETKELYEAEKERILDVCEGVLLKEIHSGNIEAVKWYLSRIGKSRGYNERHEVTGAEGEPIEVKWQK